MVRNKEEKTPVVFTDDALLQAIASVNGGITPTKAEGVELFPISAAIRKARKPFNIGDLVPDQGVYLGQYRPIDRDGISLGKVFNVFAAPEDLPDRMVYVCTVKYIAELEKWHGFDGTNYRSDKEIYAALKDGSYNGGWIIPPRELLVGTAADEVDRDRQGKVIQLDNLFDHQDKGTFKGTFKTRESSGADLLDWYWSSTENRSNPLKVFSVQLFGGHGLWDIREFSRSSCRPVRLVEVLGG